LAAPLLQLKGISKRFGGLLALNDVNAEVASSHIHALIGPNGAGKTTLTNVITGVFPPTSGEVWFKGANITKLRPDAIATRGISRTFQNLRTFPTMTALENVMVGRHLRSVTSPWAALFRLPFTEPAEERDARDKSRELLHTVGLAERANSPVAKLSLMEQRRVEIARALAVDPDLLILDEPTAGMGAAESRMVQDLIQELSKSGITILVIAHDMQLVMSVAHRITVLNFGVKIAEGAASEIRLNRQVEEAYLGTE